MKDSFFLAAFGGQSVTAVFRAIAPQHANLFSAIHYSLSTFLLQQPSIQYRTNSILGGATTIIIFTFFTEIKNRDSNSANLTNKIKNV
jgi:hypothetical protein